MSGLSRRDLVVGLFTAANLASCSPGPTYSFNFRTVVTVTLRESQFVGEGVQACRAYLAYAFPNPGTNAMGGLYGEAVPVELPAGRILFALLNRFDSMGNSGYLERWRPEDILAGHYGVRLDWTDSNNDGMAFLGKIGQGEIIHLSRDQFPTFATFDNPSDPATAKLVDPDTLNGLGPGGIGRVESVTIQLTGDVITRESSRLLPMLRGRGATLESFGMGPFEYHRSYFTTFI